MSFRHLERRTVSRKTQRDGKLEITRAAAARLGQLDNGLQVEMSGRTAPATLDRMTCKCDKSEQPHEHYFVQSDLLRELVAGSEVDLSLDAACSLISVREAE